MGSLWLLLVCGCGSDAAEPAMAVAAVSAAPGPQIAAGGGTSFVSFAHSCAIVDAQVQCWGADDAGQLGDGFATMRNPLPTRVRASTGFDGAASAIAAGRTHTCALRSGNVWCWGQNDRRQIAALRPSLFPEPARIAGLPQNVSAIAAGGEFSCAIAAGRLWCWGRGSDGELGRPSDAPCGGYRADESCAAKPAIVQEMGDRVQTVALGAAHGCAIENGEVFCWGRNSDGQLGDGSRAGRSAPLRVKGLTNATSIAAGDAHSCASTPTGVFCWGRNDRGQLGDGTRADRAVPTAVAGLKGATQLSAGAAHTCALSEAALYCWGANSAGQLGLSDEPAGPGTQSEPRQRTEPVLVDGVSKPAAIATAADHSCAATQEGDVLCFGANDFGQLGRGSASQPAAVPTSVAAWDRGQLRDRNADGRIVVSCLGDSNTQAGFRVDSTWCEILEHAFEAANWQTVNRGWSGATAVSLTSLRRAAEQLEYTLQFDAPDAVILAYGTNDLLQNATPEDFLGATLRLLLRAREFGVDTFVALVPPSQNQSDTFDLAVSASNALLRKAIRADRLIDFHSGFSADDFTDRIHFNERGHARRARAAHAVLRTAR